MEYIHAALLLHKAGKKITEASLKKVLDAAGVKADDARMKALISALKDVNIEKAIATPVAIAAPAAVAAPVEKAPAAKEEEKESEENKDENAAAGLAALFG